MLIQTLTVCNFLFTFFFSGIADSSTRHIAKLVSRQKVTSKSRRISKPTRSTKPVVVPSYFRANIKDLLSCHHDGVLGSELSKTYAKRYGEEINYKKLGFKSLGNLLNSIPDIATIVQIPQGGFRVYAKIQKKSSPTGTVFRDDLFIMLLTSIELALALNRYKHVGIF